MLQNSLVAVTHASASDPPEAIRDSSVAGYVYVADVDEGKKRVKLLTAVAERVPALARALVVGAGWPEDVPDLVS